MLIFCLIERSFDWMGAHPLLGWHGSASSTPYKSKHQDVQNLNGFWIQMFKPLSVLGSWLSKLYLYRPQMNVIQSKNRRFPVRIPGLIFSVRFVGEWQSWPGYVMGQKQDRPDPDQHHKEAVVRSQGSPKTVITTISHWCIWIMDLSDGEDLHNGP